MKAALAPARQRDGAATRARIEREALRLFAEKGVDGATIRDLAQAVGVADAALYRYFGSKDAIAAELFTRHYGALAGQIAQIGARRLPFRQTIAALVDLFCGLFDDEPHVFAFILLSQHAHLRFVSPEANAVEELRKIMAHAQASGEIAVSDPELAAAMALGAVLQPAVFKLYGRLPGPLRARAQDLARAAALAAGATD
ncbi:MAG: transcriptional regulator, TetR family [Hyphomicrobiales bacterium]|nr:transcriptional regulator, TetR family [Hyphomicrobiales bacterium]